MLHHIRTKFRKPIFDRYRQDVTISQLRCNTLPTHLEEGYGGKPIEYFPPHMFFSLRLAGHKEEATNEFCSWYAEQFQKYVTVPKSVGGMYMGSLHRLVIQAHLDEGIKLSSESVDYDAGVLTKAIAARVSRRFQLLDSINASGYDQTKSEDIEAFSHAGHVYLTGGHHRAAILSNLGRPILPGVVVFSRTQLKLLRKLRKSPREKKPS